MKVISRILIVIWGLLLLAAATPTVLCFAQGGFRYSKTFTATSLSRND